MPNSPALGSAFLLLSMMVMLADDCPTQGGVTWTQLNPANSPPARWGHAMAYDAARSEVVMFGGVTGSWPGVGVLVGDTWTWDGVTWTQRQSAVSPPARSGHSMVYDAARQRILLFGGSDAGNAHLSDTWTWDGDTWVQRFPAHMPSRRWNHAMAYDAIRQRVLLFGGAGPGCVHCGDTWLWDGVDWSRAAPLHSPPARRGHAMAFDAARQRVLMLGGSDLFARHPGAWEWDGTDWSRFGWVWGPTERNAHAMAFDALRGRVVVHGGALLLTHIDDVWEWDGAAWIGLTPAHRPSGRYSHALAYDAARKHLLLFGGTFGSDETWVLWSSAPPAFATLGTGCPGSNGIPTLDTAPFSSPWTGDTFSVELSNLPQGSMTFMVTGLSNTFWAGALIPLPTSLTSWGMPGCTVYSDVVNSELLANTSGTATWTTTIPNDANLIGVTFYNQGFIIDPGVNAMGATVSNAGEATIGMR